MTGLFQEYEIDKTLGIKGPEDVEKMGIAAYNAECRKIVMRYSTEWEVSGTAFDCMLSNENWYDTWSTLSYMYHHAIQKLTEDFTLLTKNIMSR